jgi:tRNA(Arg) A34 adenosine deaminase TadA
MRMHRSETVGRRVRDALSLAATQATKSPCAYRHGSVLIDKAKILNRGFNEMRPAAWVRFNRNRDFASWTMHAEISCMHGVPRKTLRGKTLVVVRINKSGQFLNSKPCSTCMYEMQRKGIKRVFFSLENDMVGVLDI